MPKLVFIDQRSGRTTYRLLTVVFMAHSPMPFAVLAPRLFPFVFSPFMVRRVISKQDFIKIQQRYENHDLSRIVSQRNDLQ
jgi:hypothetical protein